MAKRKRRKTTVTAITSKLEKWSGLLRIVIVLVVGVVLYYCCARLWFPYPLLAIAAIIHITEETVRLLTRRLKFQIRHKRRKLAFLSLAIPFSLYAYFVMRLWGGFAIISILILGGLVDLIRKWADLRSVFSFSIAFFALFCSVFTSQIPNILLMDKEGTAVIAENHKFFLRGFTPQDENRTGGVIIRQDPPLGGGIWGSNIVFVFRAPHTLFAFLPFPVWKTLKYEVGDVPVIRITGLREGHGDDGKHRIAIGTEDKRTVSQFTRIYGTFEDLPKGNEQLYVRVLIIPDMTVGPILDRFLWKWYVQPHEPYRPGNRFRDSAELKLIYNDGSDRDGTWHVDGFFGTPRSKEWPFEILAMITWKDFKRGQEYTREEIEGIQGRLDESVRQSTEAILRVRRDP